MKTIEQIREYLESQKSIEAKDALKLLSRVDTSRKFFNELFGMRNAAPQESKRWYNTLIDYVQEKQEDTMNWETQEVINHLINDPGECLNEIMGMSPKEIEQWVKQGNAPDQLYKSFHRSPVSSFNDVDWDEVAEAVNN